MTSPQTLMIYVDLNSLTPAKRRAVLAALGTEESGDNEVGPAASTMSTDGWKPVSVSLTLQQARQLVEGVDENARIFLRKLVSRFDPETFKEYGGCWINYAEAWELTKQAAGGEEMDKARFAKIVLTSIHRRLRTVIGRSSQIVRSYAHGGSDGNGSYYVDNEQTVRALQQAIGPHNARPESGANESDE
jgi:hypothetical protein